jgi:hypothetical protein
MENTTVTSVSVLSLSDLRNNVAEAVVRAYGAERDYAIKVCEVLPFAWYLVEHNDKGEEAKLVHTEKKELFKVLNAAKHSNPSTVWARVRKYAQEHMEPKKPTAEGETPTAETSSVGARQNRSLTLRLIEELTTLYKACKNADSLSDKERQAHTHITSALIAMGIDVATIE